jgi:hypothetical protein
MNRIKALRSLILLFPIILTSCYDTHRLNFDKGLIPVTPQNFKAVNSSQDDYNSDMDYDWSEKYFTLIFSTNRKIAGDFDFICYDCMAYSALISGEFEMHADFRQWKLIDSINSAGNELGPCLVYDPANGFFDPTQLTGAQKRFFYASDKNGSLDIYWADLEVEVDEFVISGEPAELSEINSGADDAYPTIFYDEPTRSEVLYFTSDRGGNFDIYKATGNPNKLINQSTGVVPEKVEALSTGSDDKCPYIRGDIMVFASDRAGGFGGFDLWYSKYVNNQWSVPVNFGDAINTEYDEYRPVIADMDSEYFLNNFLNNLMIFSSNRPGGKGGFDLYYVGISKSLK